jgi:hypothetical protein
MQTAESLSLITRQEVENAQKEWAKYIIEIGRVYTERGDYKNKAETFLNSLYAFKFSDVLFKPTLASEKPFRTNLRDALSYFVGGHINEDQGFAIRPWTEVRFSSPHISIYKDTAIAMGDYFFISNTDTQALKAQYTFGYIKGLKCGLMINVHHSSLPV